MIYVGISLTLFLFFIEAEEGYKVKQAYLLLMYFIFILMRYFSLQNWIFYLIFIWDQSQ